MFDDEDIAMMTNEIVVEGLWTGLAIGAAIATVVGRLRIEKSAVKRQIALADSMQNESALKVAGTPTVV